MLEEYLRKRGIRDRSERDAALAAEPGVHDRVGEQGDPADPRGARDRADDVLQRRGRSTRRPHTVTSLEGEKAEYDLLVAGAAASRAAGRDRLGPRGRRRLAADRPPHAAGRGPGAHLRDGRRDRPADQQERFDGALRGAGRREPDRVAGSGHAPRRPTTADASCASWRPGNRKATALRFDYEHPPTPPKPSTVWHSAKWMFNRLYWETVPQGRIPRAHRRAGRRRRQTMSATDRQDARPEGAVLPAADRQDGAGDQGAAARRADRGARHRSRVGRRLHGVVHDDRQRARGADARRTACTGS